MPRTGARTPRSNDSASPSSTASPANRTTTRTTDASRPGPAGGVGGSPTHDQIRQRAYEIYKSRNGAPGDPAADWLQAEQELRGRAQVSAWQR